MLKPYPFLRVTLILLTFSFLPPLVSPTWCQNEQGGSLSRTKARVTLLWESDAVAIDMGGTPDGEAWVALERWDDSFEVLFIPDETPCVRRSLLLSGSKSFKRAKKRRGNHSSMLDEIIPENWKLKLANRYELDREKGVILKTNRETKTRTVISRASVSSSLKLKGIDRFIRGRGGLMAIHSLSDRVVLFLGGNGEPVRVPVPPGTIPAGLTEDNNPVFFSESPPALYFCSRDGETLKRVPLKLTEELIRGNINSTCCIRDMSQSKKDIAPVFSCNTLFLPLNGAIAIVSVEGIVETVHAITEKLYSLVPYGDGAAALVRNNVVYLSRKGSYNYCKLPDYYSDLQNYALLSGSNELFLPVGCKLLSLRMNENPVFSIILDVEDEDKPVLGISDAGLIFCATGNQLSVFDRSGQLRASIPVRETGFTAPALFSEVPPSLMTVDCQSCQEVCAFVDENKLYLANGKDISLSIHASQLGARNFIKVLPLSSRAVLAAAGEGTELRIFYIVVNN